MGIPKQPRAHYQLQLLTGVYRPKQVRLSVCSRRVDGEAVRTGHDSRIFRRTCTPYWKVSRPRKPRERNSACDAISLSDRILRYRLRARTVRASGLQVGYI
jgi:hypothetical protein